MQWKGAGPALMDKSWARTTGGTDSQAHDGITAVGVAFLIRWHPESQPDPVSFDPHGSLSRLGPKTGEDAGC